MNSEHAAAEMDQAGAALRDVAPTVAGFHKGLRSSGMGRVDAALTAAAWLVVELRARQRDDQ